MCVSTPPHQGLAVTPPPAQPPKPPPPVALGPLPPSRLSPGYPESDVPVLGSCARTPFCRGGSVLSGCIRFLWLL